MMSRFHLALEAENTERCCHRSYTIMASMDLFGTWIVEIWYGRIGSRGRSMRYAFGEIEKAQQLVRLARRRRMRGLGIIGTKTPIERGSLYGKPVQ
jgi:predicted DNA-binding WGR domain protein